MASSVFPVGSMNRALWNINSCNAGTSLPSTGFYGTRLKKVTSKVVVPQAQNSSGKLKVVSEVDEQKQTGEDRWKGLVNDVSDDQQDIARGKGMVDSLFQAPTGTGTHNAIMNSYDYVSAGLRQYQLDNNMDGYYIAPAFMDKLLVHLSKNFMALPNIKVPLILGIWGGKGQGKSFQCELVFAKMGINPIMMSAGELESGNAGEPAKLIRQRYREAADRISKGKMCVLFINDLDAGAGRLGGTTQYTVNNQMVNATLMNIADNPTNVQLPGMYNKQENPRVPIVVTGNDFSTLYAPLIRDGRMEKFYWAPTREDRIGVCAGIFREDNVSRENIVKLVDSFPGQSIDFFGAIRARVYDDEVRNWIGKVGVENIGKMLVNSRDGPPSFDKPKMTIDKLLEYGNMLVQEQENVKRVQLADKYLNEAALGDANEDAITNGSFYGKAAQQIRIPVPEGCTDSSAANYDPTARSDDGTCLAPYAEEAEEETKSAINVSGPPPTIEQEDLAKPALQVTEPSPTTEEKEATPEPVPALAVSEPSLTLVEKEDTAEPVLAVSEPSPTLVEKEDTAEPILAVSEPSLTTKQEDAAPKSAVNVAEQTATIEQEVVESKPKKSLSPIEFIVEVFLKLIEFIVLVFRNFINSFLSSKPESN